MAFSNPMGKIMKCRDEGNKAVSSQAEVTDRGRRCLTEIKQQSARGARERSWMSSIPMSLERYHRIRPPQEAALDSAPRKTAPFLINVHFIYSA